MYKEWKLLSLKEKKLGGGGSRKMRKRSETFVKIQKKYIFLRGEGVGGLGGGGVRVDVNGEVKLL